MAESKNLDNNQLNLSDLWRLFSAKWPWFLISVVICLAAAMTYIIITPPKYTVDATLLVKENNSSNSAIPSNSESFSNLGLFNQKTDIKNELHIIQSPALMEKVVERLKLEYNYSINFRSVRKVDLYNASPVTVKLDSALSNQYVKFDIYLAGATEISLTKFKVGDIESDYETKGKLSDPIVTPFGTISVLPTAFYQIWTGKTVYFSKFTVPFTTKQCSRALKVSLSDDDASIIRLSYTDVSSQRAIDVLNTLISVYNENWIKDKNQVTLSTSQFIDERLKVIEMELGNVDDNISAFKSENLLPDVGAVSSIYLAQSTNNSTQLSSLQNQLSMARYIQEYMGDATSKDILIPANTGIGSSNIESQIERYNSLLLQKNNLESNSSRQNPIVADMIKTLNSMKEVIVRSVDDYISTLNIQLDNIRKEEQKTNRKIATNPSQAKYLLSVERQQKVKEELYLFLLQKREENELSQAFTAYNTRVVNAPDGSNAPSSPRRNIILLAALVVGLFIPAIIIILLDNFSTHVENRKDLNVLTIPFLGEIPMISPDKKLKVKSLRRKKKAEPSTVPIFIKEHSRNHINEAFRIIRTNVDFMRPKNVWGTVIMTTSAYPGSGKTFTTINLAMSMAVKGAKVIVVDTDLRVAAMSALVDNPQTGVADYLNGNITEIENLLLREKFNKNLDILPVGTIPPNPSELLLNNKFAGLLAVLKEKYDYVFLDCPPTEVVTDATIIGQFCDLTLYVIRAGLMEKTALPEIEKKYKTKQYNNMAVILNGVKLAAGRYEYGKHGYYKHGYYKHGYYEK